MSSSSALFHYSPRYVLDQLCDRYPREKFTIRGTSDMRSVLRMMLDINDKYSVETVEATLHHLINLQTCDELENRRLHEMVRSNVGVMYEIYDEQCLC